MCNFTSRITSP